MKTKYGDVNHHPGRHVIVNASQMSLGQVTLVPK